jgi:hypothetical protein
MTKIQTVKKSILTAMVVTVAVAAVVALAAVDSGIATPAEAFMSQELPFPEAADGRGAVLGGGAPGDLGIATPQPGDPLGGLGLPNYGEPKG